VRWSRRLSRCSSKLSPLTHGRHHSPGSGALAGPFCPHPRHSPLTDPYLDMRAAHSLLRTKIPARSPSSQMNGRGFPLPARALRGEEMEIRCVSGNVGSCGRLGCGTGIPKEGIFREGNRGNGEGRMGQLKIQNQNGVS
jgi:hypothetical protein